MADGNLLGKLLAEQQAQKTGGIDLLNLVQPKVPAAITPQAIVQPGLSADLQERFKLANQATHATPQGAPATTIQQDIGQLLSPITENPELQQIGSTLKEFGRGMTLPFTDDSLGKAIGSKVFDLANPNAGQPPAKVDALEGVFAEPEAAPAPAPAPAAAAEPEIVEKGTPALLDEQGQLSPDKIAEAVGDEKSFGESFQAFFENKDVSTMALAIGASLLRGDNIGNSIAIGMQALGKRKALEAATAAAGRKEDREERKLKLEEKKGVLDEKKAKQNARKTAAEIGKLNAETKKLKADAKGGGEKRTKNLISLFKIVSETQPIGEEALPEVVATKAKALLKQFEGTEDPQTGVSSERVGAMRETFAGLSVDQRNAAANAFLQLGIPEAEIIQAAQ